MEEDTTDHPLTISEGGEVIGEVIGEVGVIAGDIIGNLAEAIDHAAELFAEITDIIGESLVPIYDVSYLS